MKTKRLIIVGAGGFARELRWMAREAIDPFEFAGYVVSDPSRLNESKGDADVVGDLSWLDANPKAFDAISIGIGNPAVRLRIGHLLKERWGRERLPAIVHKSVQMDRSTCRMGCGVIVCPGVIATVNVNLSEFCLINLACTIGHEAEIGEGVVLNPTVNVSGGVRIGSGVLVGTGAQILQNLQIGDEGVVGAGAVVTKNVAPGVTVTGIPARQLTRSSA